MIFPLSIPGKIILFLIALVLGCIFFAMWKPGIVKKIIDKFQAKREKLPIKEDPNKKE
jgi:hypothetical protein